MKASTRRALALTELIIVLALFALLVALALPVIQDHRRHASIKADLSKLRLIGMASAMYADASQDRLFTFSWVPGQVPVTPNTQLAIATAELNPNTPSSHSRAAVLQQLDLVTHGLKDERLPPLPSIAPPNHFPFVTYNHLVLTRFMGTSFPSDLFISAADKQRTYWKNNLDEYLDNPAASPVRPPSTSTTFVQLWRWPFSSSFQVGVSHYSADTGPPTTAARGSSQGVWIAPSSPGVLGTRTLSQVAFPSQKAMMFDDYDRYNAKGRQYFALPAAPPPSTSTTATPSDGSLLIRTSGSIRTTQTSARRTPTRQASSTHTRPSHGGTPGHREPPSPSTSTRPVAA